ncbi:hypothetical protein LPJ53_003104 [Coemansia erecta]|uniref:Uncharacterized protein n=1 Tax=Coemansia erecta TaxID=147472 RepID=A0A9W7Y1U7_9FUNG|nr:hypothetical protein LPJ53_003104 [Coemansia erecta]
MARQDASAAALSFRDPSFTALVNARAKPSPASHDDELDSLDAFDDINSQEILDLVLHEEQQFATQQQQQQQMRQLDAVPSPSPARHATPPARTNLYPRLAPHIPPTQQPPAPPCVAQSSSSSELEHLRGENRRLRAEQAALQAQLVTRDGEVRIVREHLARTEIDNTQLQEQLAARIAAAAGAQMEAERRLQREVDRLQTALAFQQHDASTAAAAAAGRTPARKPPQARDHEARTPRLRASAGHAAFPTAEDFAATPTAAAAGPQDKPPVLPDDTDAQLLAILTGLGARPADGAASASPGGGLVAVALALARVVRCPDDDAAQLAAFSAHVRALLCRPLSSPSASSAEPAELAQRAALVHLLLRALAGLPGFRRAWVGALGADEEAARVVDAMGAALRDGLGRAAAASAEPRDALAGELAGLLAQLLLRVVEQSGSSKGSSGGGTLGSRVWRASNVLSLAGAVASPHVPLDSVMRLLQLVAALPDGLADAAPAELERFLLACTGRLRLAFSRAEHGMVEAEHAFLVLLAAVMTGEASVALINGMQGFARALVAWFLDEHAALGGCAPADATGVGPVAVAPGRVDMFVQYVMCLKVVLSEVGDVVELLGGEFDPAFFAFVAACTRLTLGERAFEACPEIRELAADLLAYVVTEDQALTIQSLE